MTEQHPAWGIDPQIRTDLLRMVEHAQYDVTCRRVAGIIERLLKLQLDANPRAKDWTITQEAKALISIFGNAEQARQL